jgi:Spy/CpxP family protein refolding chaperone
MTDKRKAIILVIILFVLGIALGAVGTHMWDTHVRASQTHHSVIKDLKSELQMTPAQETQFDAIIKQENSKFHELHAQEQQEWDPKRDSVRQQGRDSIRAILSPEQRAKFDSFVKKLDDQRRKSDAH